MTDQHGGREVRTDIQGLRAIAVAMVVLYHLHPATLPGGYAGVDVFFVISGYLITAHLLRKPPTTPRELAGFWGRRIRRLLPASLLVLACTLVAVRLVAPATQWGPNAHDARSAALYVLNWSLAERAVDYLAADDLPTAVQHYWSLSVEEQFYFIWPIVVGLAVLVARRLRLRAGACLAVALGAVVALSFAYSVTQTASDPAAAYFVTPTRMWELGVGGLLALGEPHLRGLATWSWHASARALLAWLGVAMIAATGLLYSPSTPFPGYHAALPVLGAALLLATAPLASDRLSPGTALAMRPVQWLGDVSYSVYLWHWPLVVLVPYALGHELRPLDLVGVLVATLVLAALTERFVERPFRSRRAAQHLRATYVYAAAAMTVVVVAASFQLAKVDRMDDISDTQLAQALRQGGPCFGAPALDPGSDCAPVSYDDLLPSPTRAAEDKSAAYVDVGGRQCWSSTPSFPTRTCTFGKRGSDTTIALFGNSHAGQWLPALQQVAQDHNGRVQTYLASQCASSDILQNFATADYSASCRDWVERTTAAIVEAHPDLLVMSNRVSVSAVGKDLADSQEVYAEGYERVIRRLRAAGIPVLVIRDTPAAGKLVPTCIAEKGDDYAQCDGPRDEWLPEDPVVDVVNASVDPGTRLVTLTDHICGPTTCHVVNGGVITYFDATHLTATYAHTLAPYLEPAVAAMLRPTSVGAQARQQ